jgi:hypothetical protein
VSFFVAAAFDEELEVELEAEFEPEFDGLAVFDGLLFAGALPPPHPLIQNVKASNTPINLNVNFIILSCFYLLSLIKPFIFLVLPGI